MATMIIDGSRHVLITKSDGRLSARLYVNNGETPTLQTWKGKTMRGARDWANDALAKARTCARASA